MSPRSGTERQVAARSGQIDQLANRWRSAVDAKAIAILTRTPRRPKQHSQTHGIYEAHRCEIEDDRRRATLQGL